MAAYKYEFAAGAAHRVSAQDVGETCEQLERSSVGLSPRTLLDECRDENHPLHWEFDWDDTVAAEKWRLEQARMLIAHVRIVRTDSDEENKAVKDRGFVSTPGRQGAYVSLSSALNREDLREHLLRQAKRDATVFVAKYRRLEELAGVVDAMNDFLRVE